MSETTEEGRPGRRPSSSGPGRGRGRARGRGRGLLRIAQQQDVPGGKLTTTSSPEKSLPEITSQTQDQYQDSNDSNDCCEATASRGATLQDSPKPGTLQSLGQIEGTITVGDSIVYKSILPSFTTRDGNQAVVLTKLEDKTPDKSNQMNRAIKVADLEESWNQNDDADHKSALLINVSSLPYQTSEEDITSYFERQGDEAEVCSVQIQDDGRATIKLIGLTEEEQTRLQTRKQHKINKQRVNVEIMTQIPPKLHQEDPDSTSPSQMSSTAMEYDILGVNPPNRDDEEYLKLSRSGGCDECVKGVAVEQPGTAHVQFHDPKGIKAKENPRVIVYISSVSSEIMKEDIENYFEAQGDNIQVQSAKFLRAEEKVIVELVGITAKELTRLQDKKHKIRRKEVFMDIDYPETSKSALERFRELDTVEVSGIPGHEDVKESLKFYFETKAKSADCDEVVKDIKIVRPGVAHVQFISPEGNVISKEIHEMFGTRLHVKLMDDPHASSVVQVCETKESDNMVGEYESDKLLILNIPDGVDEEYLRLFVYHQLHVPKEKYSILLIGNKAEIQFKRQHTIDELKLMITKLQSEKIKESTLCAELCKVCNSIRISGITERYDQLFLKMYFESGDMSGGGKVENVDLLGEGVAIVTFKDPKAINSVLARRHDSFGPNSVLCREDKFWLQSTTGSSTSLISKAQNKEPVKSIVLQSISQSETSVRTESTPGIVNSNYSTVTINVEPLIVKCLKKYPNELEVLVKDLKLNLDYNDKQGLIICSPTKLTPFDWNNEAVTSIQSHVEASYTLSTDQIPRNAVHELCACLCSLQDEHLFVFVINTDATKLTLAGRKEILSLIKASVGNVFENYKLANKTIPLKPSEYQFITQLKIQNVKERFPHVAITPDHTVSALRLQGEKRELEQLQQVLSKIGSHSQVSVQVQPAVVDYFNTVEGRKQLDSFIRKRSPSAPVAIMFESAENKTNLILLCDELHATSVFVLGENLMTATDVVKHEVPSSFIALQSTVLADDYPALLSQIEEQYHVMICHTSGSNIISISGFKEGTTCATKELSEFIKEKCTSTLNLKFEKGELRLLQSCGTKYWNKITRRCQSCDIQIEIRGGEHSAPIVVLKGDRENVTVIAGEVSKIREGICKANIQIERPGTCSFFLSENGRMILDGIQTKDDVAIEVSIPVRADTDSLDDCSLIHPATAKFIRKCVATKGMKKITIYVGDITEFEKADIIVNAANRELHHIGGVALSIANKGGPEIQKDSNEHVRRKGKLDTGEVWLTKKVGNLPCKALIHAVGPQWYGGFGKEEALLEKVCTETLQVASRTYRSIAFPAISSGVYGFPIAVCAKIMIKAINRFCTKNPLSDLEDVYLILHPSKASDATHFISALKQQLPSESVFVDEHIAHISKHMPQCDISEPSKSKKSKTVLQVPRSILDRVKLTKGSLLDVKADAYVNTTNGNLDLSSGAVAQALLTIGGQSLQDECFQKAPVKTGNIAVTGPGNLSCKYVFHTVVPNYSGRAEKVLRSSVQKCLQQCSSLHISSIAFPSIGTGNLRYPDDVVAKCIVDEVVTFLCSQQTTSLKVVHLVIYMQKTYQAFQSALSKWTSSSSLNDDNPPTSGMKYRPAQGNSSPTTNEELSFKIGDLQVELKMGDISSNASDVIVNPTNSAMKLLGQGVAGALLTKGGPELQQLCDTVIANIIELKGDKVAETAAPGALKCKMLFHINFDGRDTKLFHKVLTACLRKAEDRNCTSIAFPAIGTGIHGCNPQQAATVMLHAIHTFSSFKPKHLKTIQIVIYVQSIFQQFLKTFQNPESTAQPGLVRRALKFVSSFMPGGSDSVSEYDPETTLRTEIDEDDGLSRELEIKIYGETETAISKAEHKIDSLIDEMFITENVENFPELIANLPVSEEMKLRKECKDLKVKIEIDRDLLKRITLKGDKAAVHKMRSIATQVLSEYANILSKQEAAKQLSQTIQWRRMDSDESYSNYDDVVNYELEQAYKAKKPLYTFGSHGSINHFTVNLKRQVETDHVTNTEHKVERLDVIKQLREGERPTTWDPMPLDIATNKEEVLHLAQLQPSSKEYQDVKAEFDKTMRMIPATGSGHARNTLPQAGLGFQASARMGRIGVSSLIGQSDTYSSIVTIERIQNPALYSQYVARKKQMDKQNPPRHQNERLLFHGTSVDSCGSINHGGFNRSFSGRNAVVYGRGAYFARDASYSARNTYSPPDPVSGNKHIYLARVLTGEFTTGLPDMLTPPPKDPNNKHISYDSVVDNVQDPQVFVIFQDALVYPEYLIVFKQ